MYIGDVAIADVAEQWFGSRGPGEAMPDCLAWLPDQIQRQYSATSPLLWEEGSVWQLKAPRPARFDPDKMIFMSGDEGEWAWAYDANDADRFFDLGPDEEGWKMVDAGLAELLAQRNLLEIAYGPVSHRVISQVSPVLLPEVVAGLTEITTCPWRSLPGLRLHIGDGVLVVSSFGRENFAPFSHTNDVLDIRVAVTSPDKFDYLENREWPHPWRVLPSRSLEWIRAYSERGR
ncbi:hypothetical protein [Streptomyces malaysiense]|nr:hypothetical protein [Streptomyces malaysiense]